MRRALRAAATAAGGTVGVFAGAAMCAGAVEALALLRLSKWLERMRDEWRQFNRETRGMRPPR